MKWSWTLSALINLTMLVGASLRPSPLEFSEEGPDFHCTLQAPSLALGIDRRSREGPCWTRPAADPALPLEERDRIPKLTPEVLVIVTGDDDDWCLTCLNEIIADWHGWVMFRYQPSRNVWKPEMAAYRFRQESLANNRSDGRRLRPELR